MTASHYNRIDEARRDVDWDPPASFEEATRDSLAYGRELPDRRESDACAQDHVWDARPPRWSFAFPNIRWLLALITIFHRRIYLSSRGRWGQDLWGFKFLLLTHTGRKTGCSRVVPLLYVEDGQHWAVVASNAGDERNPHWLLNLDRSPRAEIQVGTQHIAVRARRASTRECQSLWPRLIESYHWYTSYRARARREIPIVILERADSHPDGASSQACEPRRSCGRQVS